MSFLDALKRYYDLFEKNNGLIPIDYKMPKYIDDFFTFVFIFYDRYYNKQENFPNEKTFKNADILSSNPHAYNILRDAANNCYLQVWSSDGKTSITIIKDNIDAKLYDNIGGIKITESTFEQALDKWRKRIYKKGNISPSVLKDENNLPDVDLWNEMQINKLIDFLCGKETIDSSRKKDDYQDGLPFLDRFKENREVFQQNKDLIPLEYKMPNYFNEFCTYLLIMSTRQNLRNGFPNNYTFKSAENLSSEVPIYNIKSDTENNCYLQIWAPDGKTSIIVHKDNVEPSLYADISGTKLKESEFSKIYDKWRHRVYEKDDVPSSILKNDKDIPPVDIYEEMEFDNIVEFTKEYVQKKRIEKFNSKSFQIFFDDNQVSSNSSRNGKTKNSGEIERKHEIIPLETRQKILFSYDPEYKITCKAKNSNKTLDAYIFKKDGDSLCVIEPVSGLGYQYLLNMGPYIDSNDQKKIEEILTTILQTSEDIILMDDAIIRKNHTTEEIFRDNLEVFLNNAKSAKPIYYDTEKSKKVYR